MPNVLSGSACQEESNNVQFNRRDHPYGALYELIQKRKPLSKKELVQYGLMCRIFTQCIQQKIAGNILEEWVLDDKKRPQYAANFNVLYRNIQLARLENSSSVFRYQIIGIIAEIASTWRSLSKRSRLLSALKESTCRTDGVESMFYAELSTWLLTDLPHYCPEDENTAKIIDRRIAYCKAVQENVLLFKHDGGRVNPKKTLDSIIAALEHMNERVKEACKIANFNQKIQLINNAVSSQMRVIFNTLHMTMEGVFENEFHIKEYLSSSNAMSRARKINRLKESLLGQWMVETLNFAGVKENSYISNKLISCEGITNHINYQFTLENLTQSGFPAFVWENCRSKRQKEQQVHQLLSLIANLHRSILKLYYVQDLLKCSRQNGFFGSSYVFSTAKGNALLDCLKAVLTDVNDSHICHLNDYWRVIYTDTYVPYSTAMAKDSNDKTYRDMEVG